MMHDVEIGRIETMMSTELSRLSRSLEDFLNIFAFQEVPAVWEPIIGKDVFDGGV